MKRIETLNRLRWIVLIPIAVMAVIVVVIPPGRSVLFDSLEAVWEWLGGPNGAETNSTTVRNAGLVLGAVVALYLTRRRIRAADRQALAAHRQWIAAGDALREAEMSRSYTIERDNAERRNSEYYKGAEMLSSGEMFARLAGLQILKGLATGDAEGFGKQTKDLLTAFVRHPPRLDQVSHGEKSEERPDVQEANAVLATLSQRNLPE